MLHFCQGYLEEEAGFYSVIDYFDTWGLLQ